MQINNQMKELKEKKLEVIKKLKKEKTLNKKNKNQYNNSPNVLTRISTKFDLKINEINEKREEIGFDRLSKPKITELIVRHDFFPKIENDLINFNTELEEKNE